MHILQDGHEYRVGESPWIAVADRLPEPGDAYLLTWNGSYLRVTRAIAGRLESSVTHWMPIPPLPTTETA